jgi:hypothetical protein
MFSKRNFTYKYYLLLDNKVILVVWADFSPLSWAILVGACA